MIVSKVLIQGKDVSVDALDGLFPRTCSAKRGIGKLLKLYGHCTISFSAHLVCILTR